MQQSSSSHLNEFTGFGMGQNALLCLKKSLDVTAKGMMWCDYCSWGKLRAIESLKGEGLGLSVDHAQEGGKSQSSPFRSPLPKHVPVWKSWSNLCQIDAPEEPSFQHRFLLPVTEASTSPLPFVPAKVQLQLSSQQDKQHCCFWCKHGEYPSIPNLWLFLP